MAIEAILVALSQGTTCDQATFQDQTDYSTEDIPSQRREYQEIVPASTSGKTNVPLIFTSGATTVTLNVAILSGDTVAQKVAKIVAAINGNTTIAAIVTAVDSTTKVTVTADTDDVTFDFESSVDTGSDLACTVTTFPASTRTLTFEYSTGDTVTVAFPYVDGTGDTYTLSDLTKDYAIRVTMVITPQVEVVGSVYSTTIIPVFACNANVCKGAIAADYRVDMQDMLCGNPKLTKMSNMDAVIAASQYSASIGDLAGAQALLDQANAICNC
jgi:hypothetical protein